MNATARAWLGRPRHAGGASATAPARSANSPGGTRVARRRDIVARTSASPITRSTMRRRPASTISRSVGTARPPPASKKDAWLAGEPFCEGLQRAGATKRGFSNPDRRRAGFRDRPEGRLANSPLSLAWARQQSGLQHRLAKRFPRSGDAAIGRRMRRRGSRTQKRSSVAARARQALRQVKPASAVTGRRRAGSPGAPRCRLLHRSRLLRRRHRPVELFLGQTAAKELVHDACMVASMFALLRIFSVSAGALAARTAHSD